MTKQEQKNRLINAFLKDIIPHYLVDSDAFFLTEEFVEARKPFSFEEQMEIHSEVKRKVKSGELTVHVPKLNEKQLKSAIERLDE